MEKQITKYEKQELYDPMTISDVKTQISLIQSLMKDVMKEDEHYGLIPGCGKKNVLLKAGAEKLAFVFRHTVKFDVITNDLPKRHREYEVKTEIRSQDGRYLGAGVGCCATEETKYKYRSDDTGKEVPKEYWKSRDVSLIGGDNFSVKKKGDKWLIHQKIEHDNPADYYNTCLKVAKKRSMIDAEITVCAASDIFTQDLEEGVHAENAKKAEKSNGEPLENIVDKKEKPLKKETDSKKETTVGLCEDCDAELTAKVYDYSMEKFKKPLCFSCQKKQK